MQAVILAAGKGTRMGTLTKDVPKPMLEAAGRSLLEHKFEVLPSQITEVILVIGYLGEKIQAHFKDEYKGRKITYVWQKELRGTASALFEAKDKLTGPFIVMMGDDLYAPEDLEKMIAHPWGVLVRRAVKADFGAKVVLGSEGELHNIIERQEVKAGDLLNCGLYALDVPIFNYEPVQWGNGEYGLPQTILLAVKEFDVKVVEATFWKEVSNPEDLEEARKELEGATVLAR